ncbi:hypothetical protein VNO78_10712 [Psophocarpus tetragonolobus]|uniref:Uncharacterized protein n=1 Tax=Psophocarpus tetragonolobus TaxID=3891 RepID=A0AAN9SLS0_PSOTE
MASRVGMQADVVGSASPEIAKWVVRPMLADPMKSTVPVNDRSPVNVMVNASKWVSLSLWPTFQELSLPPMRKRSQSNHYYSSQCLFNYYTICRILG